VLSHRHGDSVCLNCFVLFRSPITGQSNLMTHAKGCWKAQYIDSMDLGRDMGVNDRRRMKPDGTVILSVLILKRGFLNQRLGWSRPLSTTTASRR
jgi:hypothetical protein